MEENLKPIQSAWDDQKSNFISRSTIKAAARLSANSHSSVLDKLNLLPALVMPAI